MSTDIIEIPKETALTVFSADNGLEPFMAKIRAEIDAFVPDISTKKGRDAVASIAFKVAKSKTYLDGVGKDLVAELKELPKKIDASRKEMRDTLDAWKDEVRKPLTEWEAEESQRIRERQAWVDGLRRDAAAIAQCAAEEINISIGAIESTIIDGEWLGEFESEARRTKDDTLAMLRSALAAREKYEAEQAELAKLRVEAELRAQQDRDAAIAKEAEQRATQEAERKAQAEREEVIRREAQVKAESDRRELEQKLLLERAEREKAEALLAAENAKKDAERKAQEAVEAEQRRVAAEQQRPADETAAREKDRAHKTATNRSAMKAFIEGGLSEECAKLAVTLIAKRAIPNISIAY